MQIQINKEFRDYRDVYKRQGKSKYAKTILRLCLSEQDKACLTTSSIAVSYTHLPQQEKALEELGIPLPNPEKPKGRNNNRKQTFDAVSYTHLVKELLDGYKDEIKADRAKDIADKSKTVADTVIKSAKSIKER